MGQAGTEKCVCARGPINNRFPTACRVSVIKGVLHSNCCIVPPRRRSIAFEKGERDSGGRLSTLPSPLSEVPEVSSQV